MMNWYVRLIIGCFFLNVGALYAQQKDVAGSKDHPLVSRFASSVIVDYKVDEFDEIEITLGRMDPKYKDSGGIEWIFKKKNVEGQRTRFFYMMPEKRTPVEVMRNYKEALARANWKILFECAREACGDSRGFHSNNPKRRMKEGYMSWVMHQQFLTGVLSKPDGDVYISVFTADDRYYDRTTAFVEIVETKAMEGGKVKINAEAMSKGLAAEGKVALYDIYFDYDKVELKPESKPQLEEMAKLLKNNPKLKVYIVGHTDNQGGLEYNRGLSQRRADAVVRALTTQYAIDSKRLAAYGVANLTPVANNAAEAGRAKNRRVELVEQ